MIGFRIFPTGHWRGFQQTLLQSLLARCASRSPAARKVWHVMFRVLRVQSTFSQSRPLYGDVTNCCSGQFYPLSTQIFIRYFACDLRCYPLCFQHHLKYFAQDAVGCVPHTSQDGVIAAGSFPPVRRRGILAYTRNGVAIGKCQEQACTSTSYAARFILSVQLLESRVDAKEPTLQYP